MCFAYFYFTWMSLRNDDSKVCLHNHPAGKVTLNLPLTRVPTSMVLRHQTILEANHWSSMQLTSVQHV